MVLIMIIIRNRSVYLGLARGHLGLGGFQIANGTWKAEDRIDASAEQDDRLRHCRVGGVGSPAG